MSDLVRNLNCWFSHAKANILTKITGRLKQASHRSHDSRKLGFLTRSILNQAANPQKIARHLKLSDSKPTFRICKNKDPDQLCSNCEADRRLCFRYMDSVIPLVCKFKISSI